MKLRAVCVKKLTPVVEKTGNFMPGVSHYPETSLTTETSTKTSPQSINLLYHKSFGIIPSCAGHTLLVKYPKNELGREISE